MSVFTQKLAQLHKDGKALVKFTKQVNTYIVYEGPYWGIWIYSKESKRMKWKAFHWDDISNEYTKYNRKLKKNIKEPIVPCLLDLGLNTIGKPHGADVKLIVWTIGKHKLMSKSMEYIKIWINKLKDDNNKILYNYENILVEFLWYTGLAGYTWLNENYAGRITAIVTLHSLTHGYRSRKVLYNYLLKYSSAKKALKKHYPSVLPSIINIIAQAELPYNKFALLAKHDLNKDDLNAFVRLVNDRTQGRDPSSLDKERIKYWSWLAHKHGKAGLQLWTDTYHMCDRNRNNMYLLDNDIADQELEVVRNFRKNNMLPMAELQHVHNVATQYINDIAVAARLNRSKTDAERHDKAIKFYNMIEKDIIFIDGISLLKTHQQFIDEGREMHHCIASYFDVGIGSQMMFKIRINDEKASLQIGRNDGEIYQLYGPCNAPVSNNIKRLVIEFLQRNNWNTIQEWLKLIKEDEPKVIIENRIYNLVPFAQLNNI